MWSQEFCQKVKASRTFRGVHNAHELVTRVGFHNSPEHGDVDEHTSALIDYRLESV
jgi:hypothetical protein